MQVSLAYALLVAQHVNAVDAAVGTRCGQGIVTGGDLCPSGRIRIGRNQPCPCGKRKLRRRIKYKHCCGRKA